MSRNQVQRPGLIQCVLAFSSLLLGASALAATDDLRVQVLASGPGGPVSTNDGDGDSADGAATKGVISVDFTVPGRSFHAGQSVGELGLRLAAVSGGGSGVVYPVSVTVRAHGNPAVAVLDGPLFLSVLSPGAAPGAIPDVLSLPVSITADEARAAGLASCVDGVPPDPLVRMLSFDNPTAGRNRLGNGPNVRMRVSLSCRDEEFVFCTAGQGCFGQPGGNVGGDIAMCNDPLAGWVTRNAADVFPLTLGGSHDLGDTRTVAGACGDSTYSSSSMNGQGTGSEFQTMCGQAGAIAFLPAGSTPGSFRPADGSDREISSVSDLLSSDHQGSGSRGSGAGVLAGQALSLKLSVALGALGRAPFRPAVAGTCQSAGGSFACSASAANAGAACETASGPDDSLCFENLDFAPSALGGFQLPSSSAGRVELCTQLSGNDRRLAAPGDCGTVSSDDECLTFVLPDCVAGLSVGELLSAAEETLSGGSSAVCGGDPALLNDALDVVNQAFDGCGRVVDCSALGHLRAGAGSGLHSDFQGISGTTGVNSTGVRTSAAPRSARPSGSRP